MPDSHAPGTCLYRRRGPRACFKLLARSRGRRVFPIAPVPAGRLAELALERAVEGCFGFVSHIGGNLGDTSGRLFERPRGNLKSPTRQVRHRGLGKISSETVHQGGTRNSHLGGQIRDGPRVSNAAVKQGQALAYDRIAGSREPARL